MTTMLCMQGYSYDRPLVVSPASPRWLKLIIVLSHLLVMLFVMTLLSINLLTTLVLTVMIVFSFVYYYRLHIRKSLNKSVLYAVHSFHKGEQMGWSICLSNKQKKTLPVELLPSSFVSIWMVILNFKDPHNHRYSLIVLNDVISKQTHRQLRVRLKVMS